MIIVDASGGLLLPGEGWRPQRFAVTGRTIQEAFSELLLTPCFSVLNHHPKTVAGGIKSLGSLVVRIGMGGYSETTSERRRLISHCLWTGERSGSAPDLLFPVPPEELLPKGGE